ncbi:MAG: ribosomal protein S18-alanine N-acetyltransferase [Actinomycetes bacterium]
MIAPGRADEVRLRPMRWRDVEPATALERELFAVDAWTPELFWSELAGVPTTRWYTVASVGERLVGYAGLMVIGREADVQTVAVARRMQGEGLGRALLEALVSEAGRRGCANVMLEVASDNAAARTLYDHLGFTEVRRRRDYYAPGTDAVVMRRRIRDGSRA